MRYVDSILKPLPTPKPVLVLEASTVSPIPLPTSPKRQTANLFGFLGRLAATSKLAIFILLLSAVVPLSAFEAHIINVTATVERRDETTCDARSKGYWANHEGCLHGTGASAWETQVINLSAQLSGVFQTMNGTDMCVALWTPLCPPGATVASARCKAKSHLLADELNVVSGRLDLNALIAAADDGRSAFDTLGLTAYSTVLQALQAIEAVIASPTSTKDQLRDAGDVAQRIYGFYENENPFTPSCIYDPDDVPVCYNRGGGDYLDPGDGKEEDQEQDHSEEDKQDKEKDEKEEDSSEGEVLGSEDEEKSSGDNLEQCCAAGRSSCCNRLEDRGLENKKENQETPKEEQSVPESGDDAGEAIGTPSVPTPETEESLPDEVSQEALSTPNPSPSRPETSRPDRPERPGR